jgi:hypothetical protein
LKRVQEIYKNPVYEDTQRGVEELDDMFWQGREYKVEHYTAAKFNSMHIGDFVLAEEEASPKIVVDVVSDPN